MDAGQIGELTRWARTLQETGGSEEARAAARAILLLVGEVERLQGELEGRGGEAAQEKGSSKDEEPPAPEPPASGGWLRRALRAPR